MSDAPTIRASFLRRTGNDVPMQAGRDHWYDDVRGSDGP